MASPNCKQLADWAGNKDKGQMDARCSERRDVIKFRPLMGSPHIAREEPGIVKAGHAQGHEQSRLARNFFSKHASWQLSESCIVDCSYIILCEYLKILVTS